MTLHRLELPQVPERHDRGRLAAQVDHLVGARITGWKCGHGNTQGPGKVVHTACSSVSVR